MKNYLKNKQDFLFQVTLPLLALLFAFCAGLFFGWLPSLNKGIAEIIMYLTLMAVPLGFILVFLCMVSGIFLKILRPYAWYGAIAIILFFVGMELTSQMPSMVIVLLRNLAIIVLQSDVY